MRREEFLENVTRHRLSVSCLARLYLGNTKDAHLFLGLVGKQRLPTEEGATEAES